MENNKGKTKQELKEEIERKRLTFDIVMSCILVALLIIVGMYVFIKLEKYW